ncbi:MAG: alpha-amylase family glycosyl hydrolase, partial [Anaerolineae bacterium]|nr:alpha-amylase family glycosyl hydrolase [Anaerolineae bacterium]
SDEDGLTGLEEYRYARSNPGWGSNRWTLSPLNPDSDGDGIGDLNGLIAKLDYLNDGDPATSTDLGVTGIWLMPVAESPSYHGYDVVDYKKIEKDYGTNEDFKRLISEAHKRGIVVITDLVLNHTSSEHPWFVDAQTPGSAHENWYIWSNERPDYLGPWGQQVWHKSGLRYYYALFWEKMPDLNYRNGAVTEAMLDITRFWLEEMGVDGFRLDAIRHLIEEGPIQENTEATHEWIKGFNRFVHTINPDALIVGEVWDETAEIVRYIGGKLDVAFEFALAEALLDSVWRGDNAALVAAQEKIIAHYPKGQYAPFLTNHDQNRVMNALRNDWASARLAATLLLTNPGVPFIYYGEEIGMRGAKPDERIRTPMQWDSSPTAGFTTGTPWQQLAGDVTTVNVATQSADDGSLLNHYRALIQLRMEHPALRAGDMALVKSDSCKVYAALRYGEGEAILIVANLSETPVTDYALSLASGPLKHVSVARMLLGEGQPIAPVVNAAGGFDAYTPLPTLEPKSALVIALK